MYCPLTPGPRFWLQYHFVVVLALLLLFCGRLAYNAESASVNPPFAVTGAWQVDSDSGIGWVRTATDLRFMAGEAINKQKTYRAILEEPLPEGDWTIDFYVRFNCSSVNLQLKGENPNPKQKSPIFIMSLDGRGLFQIPIHWIRVASSPTKEKITIMIDGKQYTKKAAEEAPIPINPAGHISLSMSKYNYDEREDKEVARVLSFTVSKGADTPMQVLGPAFYGWTTPFKKKAFAGVKNLESRMDLVFQSATTDMGKSYALAAKMLMEFDESRCVNAKTWGQLSAFVLELMPRDRAALAVVLPIAAACGSALQREQIKAWTDQYFDVRFGTDWQKMHGAGGAERALLLDPIRVTPIGSGISGKTVPYWASVIRKSAPQYALLPIIYSIQSEGWKPEECAWYLPDMLEASPAYYRRWFPP